MSTAQAPTDKAMIAQALEGTAGAFGYRLGGMEIDILADAVAKALDADRTRARADAWDEGYIAASADALRDGGCEYFVEDADNPYRKG